MEKFEKAKHITFIVFNSIWLAISLFMYIGGLRVFTQFKANEDTFAGWMVWGFFCAIIIIPLIFQTIKKSTLDGARDGANTYTASVSGNNVTVSNHPFLGAIFGFIAGVVIGLAVGPIAAPIYMIKTIIKIVKNAMILKKSL